MTQFQNFAVFSNLVSCHENCYIFLLHYVFTDCESFMLQTFVIDSMFTKFPSRYPIPNSMTSTMWRSTLRTFAKKILHTSSVRAPQIRFLSVTTSYCQSYSPIGSLDQPRILITGELRVWLMNYIWNMLLKVWRKKIKSKKGWGNHWRYM